MSKFVISEEDSERLAKLESYRVKVYYLEQVRNMLGNIIISEAISKLKDKIYEH